MKVVAFTGYRPEKLNFKEADENYIRFRKILFKVINRLSELGYNVFISGIARGFDTWAAEDVCQLKNQNQNIKLVCAVPHHGQADKWREKDKIRRQKLIDSADKTVIISNAYTKECFHQRNRYMVDNADVVVCCFDGKDGGTAYTVNYAMIKDKVVIKIDPSNMKVEVISDKKIN